MLDQCVETCLSMVEAQAAAKDINLAYVLDPAVPRHLVTDTLRLQQVIVNLLNHSLRITESGEIVIFISAGPDAPRSSSAPPASVGSSQPSPPSSSSSSSPLASSGSHLPRRHSLPGSRLSRSSSSLHDLPDDDDSNDVDSDHGSTSSVLGDVDRSHRRRSRSRTRTSPASRTAEQFYTSARWLTSVVSNPSLPTSPASRMGLALTDPDDMDNDSAEKTGRRTENKRGQLAEEVKEEEEGQTNSNRSIELHFRVRNSSKAVSEEEMEQLFRPFSYGSAVHAFQYGGGGLGTEWPLSAPQWPCVSLTGQRALRSSRAVRVQEAVQDVRGADVGRERWRRSGVLCPLHDPHRRYVSHSRHSLPRFADRLTRGGVSATLPGPSRSGADQPHRQEAADVLA